MDRLAEIGIVSVERRDTDRFAHVRLKVPTDDIAHALKDDEVWRKLQ
jgi:hypothetical protein